MAEIMSTKFTLNTTLDKSIENQMKSLETTFKKLGFDKQLERMLKMGDTSKMSSYQTKALENIAKQIETKKVSEEEVKFKKQLGIKPEGEKEGGILSTLLKIAAGVGITAMIWSALEPILRPLLTLMKLVFMVLFLPLIPILKPLLKNMAEGIKAIVQAQKTSKEGGGDPLAQFTAGLTTALGYPAIWAPVGLFLAMGLIGGLKTLNLAGIIAGALLATLGLIIAWDTITGADESSFIAKFSGSLSAGILAGLVAFLFKSKVSWALGLLTFETVLGFSFLYAAIKEKDFLKAVGDAFVAALSLTLALKGVLNLLKIGGGMGTITYVEIGFLIFSTILGFKFLYQAVQEKDLTKAILEAMMGSVILGLVAAAIIALLGLGGGLAATVGIVVGIITLIATLAFRWKKQKADTSEIQDYIDEQGTIHLGGFGGGKSGGKGAGRQIGGVISQEGMYNLHRGERVLSATEKDKKREVPIVINLNIDKPIIRQDADIKELVRQIETKLQSELRRRVSYT